MDKEEVDPASAKDPVDRRCFRGSRLCHICSRPRWVGAEEDKREGWERETRTKLPEVGTGLLGPATEREIQKSIIVERNTKNCFQKEENSIKCLLFYKKKNSSAKK